MATAIANVYAVHATQLAHGLHYLHTEAGMMHRDLKSPNLLLSSKGELKIADFGLCCLGDEGQTNQIMEIGTLRWMSPEVAAPDFNVATHVFHHTLVFPPLGFRSPQHTHSCMLDRSPMHALL